MCWRSDKTLLCSQAFPSRFGEAETPPAASMQTHHSDFISLDPDIRASEVAQSGDRSNAGRIHQVPIMIQHVNIHSNLPHLTTHTDTHIIFIITVDKIPFSLFLCAREVVCFTFSPDTTHRDSVSMHLEFLKHLSSCLFSFTDSSDCLERQKTHS